MKKLTAFVLTLFLFACLTGCNASYQKVGLLETDNVESVAISSHPAGFEYIFYNDAAKEIVEHLANLHLSAKFKENPDDYDGMTWEVSVQYENGEKTTVYHFGNLFIRTQEGPWYKMAEDEAGYLDTLIEKLNSET